MPWIWERSNWPQLTWRQGEVSTLLFEVQSAQMRFAGRMKVLGFRMRDEAALDALTLDVVKSSEIEGERLDLRSARSSIARRLGIEIDDPAPIDRSVEGIAEITVDAVQKADKSLTAERLFGWHRALFPDGRSGSETIRTGDWRDDHLGPMQVVSGIAYQNVHYVAPPADRVAAEMQAFLDWFNAPSQIDPTLKAALAHLWFVTIHPFDDGNGRIGRAVSDLLLTRSEHGRKRFYSMSAQIMAERKSYYEILESTQRDDVDVTQWMTWYLSCLGRAVAGADSIVSAALSRDRFWKAHAGKALNKRQIKVIDRLLDGFEGKLTTLKWTKLAKCSRNTASGDINGLIRAGILRRSEAGGRSAHYELALPTEAPFGAASVPPPG